MTALNLELVLKNLENHQVNQQITALYHFSKEVIDLNCCINARNVLV